MNSINCIQSSPHVTIGDNGDSIYYFNFCAAVTLGGCAPEQAVCKYNGMKLSSSHSFYPFASLFSLLSLDQVLLFYCNFIYLLFSQLTLMVVAPLQMST